MLEAMACGTPVIARPCGAVPEVLVDGVTGFLAERLDDLVGAVRAVDRLDRAACRAHVETNFSVGRMADDYESLYRRLLRTGLRAVS
jgi:glycosyltransferase involved in cell wall biosynthesis